MLPVAFEIASFAFGLMEKLPALIQAGVDVMPLIERNKQQVTAMANEGRPPTDSEWNLQNEELDRLANSIRTAHFDASPAKPGA